MRSDLERLRDIEEALTKIERYAVQGKSCFFEDELVQTWILFHLQIIGEASRAMSESIKARHSEVEWQNIIDFRNLVVHEYFRVDLEIVWRIVENDLALLSSQIKIILDSFTDN